MDLAELKHYKEKQAFVELQGLLHQAGINISEASIIFEVSRHTIYKWFSGEGIDVMHPVLRAVSIQKMDGIKKALAHKELPLVAKDDYDRHKERLDLLLERIWRYLE